MRPKREPDIEAEVTFLPTAQGGRTTPVFSGYRPQHQIRPDYLTSGHHEYIDRLEVWPGESAIAEIWFLAPDRCQKSMCVDKVIPVQEGSQIIGHAKVLKILNPLLEQ